MMTTRTKRADRKPRNQRARETGADTKEADGSTGTIPEDVAWFLAASTRPGVILEIPLGTVGTATPDQMAVTAVVQSGQYRVIRCLYE